MPLVRISVGEMTSSAQRELIAEQVYQAMRETINTPEGDRFIFVSSHSSGERFVDPHFMEMHRTDSFVLVHIFLARGRTIEQKKALYLRMSARIQKVLDISSDDIMTVLSENSPENWSFGKGQAQFATHLPSWLEETGTTAWNEPR
jgi:4-oxalocrotonate tautomerase